MANALGAFVVASILYTFYFAPIFGFGLTYYIIFHTVLWPVIPLYLIWMYIDRNTCHQGGRRFQFIRDTSLWYIFRNYFPQRLIKTADLSPEKNYLVCFAPHGILATAALSHFANDNSQAREYFPRKHFEFHGFTLTPNFFIPFFREISMGFGLTSVTKQSFLYILNQGPGKLCCMYPGGAPEALLTRKGAHRTLVHKKKGFIKLAIISGTSLVPVFAFGETDLFEHWVPSPDSLANKFQNFVQYLTGAVPCFFYGRGIFNEKCGLIPYAKPVTAVMGKPIDVEKNLNPSNEEINQVHQLFIDELTKIFNEHKHKYLSNPDEANLEFVN